MMDFFSSFYVCIIASRPGAIRWIWKKCFLMLSIYSFARAFASTSSWFCARPVSPLVFFFFFSILCYLEMESAQVSSNITKCTCMLAISETSLGIRRCIGSISASGFSLHFSQRTDIFIENSTKYRKYGRNNTRKWKKHLVVSITNVFSQM